MLSWLWAAAETADVIQMFLPLYASWHVFHTQLLRWPLCFVVLTSWLEWSFFSDHVHLGFWILLVFGCLFLLLDLRIPWHHFIEQILYAFSFLGLISCSYFWALEHWSFSLFSLLVFGCSIFLALTFNMVFFSSADQACWWCSPCLLLLLLLVLLIPSIFIWLFFFKISSFLVESSSMLRVHPYCWFFSSGSLIFPLCGWNLI